jgi:hypothetical protein
MNLPFQDLLKLLLHRTLGFCCYRRLSARICFISSTSRAMPTQRQLKDFYPQSLNAM